MSKKHAVRKQNTNTIDAIHQTKIQSFNKESKKLNKMKKRVKEIALLLDEFNNESDSLPVVKIKKSRRGRKKKADKEQATAAIISTSKIKTYDEYYTLLEEKEELEKKINNITNQEDITNYYLENVIIKARL